MTDSKSIVPAADRKTLVEEGTQFKGSLSSSCPIVVRGRIEGDVVAPSLTIAASGAVHGKVKVDDLRSQGEIAGEFDADLVQLSGSVKDNTIVRAKSLEVKLAPANGKLQVVFGDCTLEVGEQTLASDTGASRLEDGVKEIVAPPSGKNKGSKGTTPPVPSTGETGAA